jgi:lysophospholipase L1-like esterase
MRRARAVRLVPAIVIVVVCLATEPAGGTIRPGRLAIGDSVMLGAKSELKAHGFSVVDAVVSRQFYAAPTRVVYRKRRGKLPKNVVIHLGTNGIVRLSDCDHAVQAAGNRRVFLVNLKGPLSWRTLDNHRLRRCARRFGNAYLVNWYRYSHDHPSWFARDGIHLTSSGARAYAGLISRRIAAVG